jgi:RNA polymerase sigma factor (sigma-70 family)
VGFVETVTAGRADVVSTPEVPGPGIDRGGRESRRPNDPQSGHDLPKPVRHGGEESDARLLEQCRAGSEAAFDVIVRRYQAPLLRHCARIAGQAAAQDAVQDAFLAVWSAIRAGAEIRTLRPWLFTIAHRKAIATRLDQRLASHPLVESLARGASPADETSQSALVRATLTALAELPESQRDALVGSALHGRSGHQIALQLGISECALRQLIFRARASLRTTAAACCVPPILVARVLHRLARSSPRLAALTRAACPGRAEGTGRLLKATVVAVASVTAVGSGAFHLSGPPRRSPSNASAPAAPARAARRGERQTDVAVFQRVTPRPLVRASRPAHRRAPAHVASSRSPLVAAASPIGQPTPNTKIGLAPPSGGPGASAVNAVSEPPSTIGPAGIAPTSSSAASSAARPTLAMAAPQQLAQALTPALSSGVVQSVQTVTAPAPGTAAQTLNPVQALGEAALPALAQTVPAAQTSVSTATQLVQTLGQPAVSVVTQPVQAISQAVLPAAGQTLPALAPSGTPTAIPTAHDQAASPALASVAQALLGVG